MTNKTVSIENVTKVGVEETSREYSRPEVHDLGKLEQVQGGIGFHDDHNQDQQFITRL